MSLFKRTPPKATSKPETSAPRNTKAPPADNNRALDVAKMIKEQLDTQTAEQDSIADDVWENPFEAQNTVEDDPLELDTIEETGEEQDDNILSLSKKAETPARKSKLDEPNEELSIDDIRKNILRITEDWRLSAAAVETDIDEDVDEAPVKLVMPQTEDPDPFKQEFFVKNSAIIDEAPVDRLEAYETLEDIDSEDEPETLNYETRALETEAVSVPLDEDLGAEALQVDDVEMDDEAENAPHLTAQGLNLGELRLDIARISSDIDNGEALYRRAQQRVTSLMGFIEKAEVAVSVLNRLQPENRRLISKNRSLETDVEAQKYIIASLENDRTKLRDGLEQSTHREETLRGQFTELKAILDERNRENEALLTEADASQMQLERVKTNLEIANRENTTLNERMNDLSEHIKRLSEEKINTEKALESAKADLSDELDRNNSLEAENSELRISLRTSNRHNSEMHNELMEVQDKIVIYKTQHETHLHRRDDRIIVLESRIKELEKIIKHKDEIVQTKTDNVSGLKKAVSRHEIEREKLEKIIEDQNYQLSKAEEELLSSKHDIAELDQQYKDLAKALSKRPATTQFERKRKSTAKARTTPIIDDDDEDPTPLKVSA